MNEYRQISIARKRELYATKGPSCNVCKDWYTDNTEDPCLSCTGGITVGDYSNFELHPELAQQ